MTRHHAPVGVLIAALVAAGGLVAACGPAAVAAGPAPVPDDVGPFGTSTRCDQFGHRVYTRTAQGSLAVVPNDRSCPQPSPRASDR